MAHSGKEADGERERRESVVARSCRAHKRPFPKDRATSQGCVRTSHEETCISGATARVNDAKEKGKDLNWAVCLPVRRWDRNISTVGAVERQQHGLCRGVECYAPPVSRQRGAARRDAVIISGGIEFEGPFERERKKNRLSSATFSSIFCCEDWAESRFWMVHWTPEHVRADGLYGAETPIGRQTLEVKLPSKYRNAEHNIWEPDPAFLRALRKSRPHSLGTLSSHLLGQVGVGTVPFLRRMAFFKFLQYLLPQRLVSRKKASKRRLSHSSFLPTQSHLPPYEKDLFHAVAIYTAPPKFPKNEFDAKLGALVDRLLLLPVFQENVLKLEMMYQNALLDEHIRKIKFPPYESTAVITVQIESQEVMSYTYALYPDRGAFTGVLRDAKFQDQSEQAKEFGLQDGICTFSTDVMPKFDSSSPSAQDGTDFFTI
ncbi:hypothetical protein B0H19DRAFT_1230360 [Mycena capillaripes]|nr:hypothetical protein B0H19DRAFT_1230360 [Mycena capillaripes]